ncbi:hypothetical protein E4T50_16821 [Aureobasidium sp. EXF-12298]|nr:hypothetical protein E4T50_16821 [Aureobasidium sp. EXF-12298]
MSWSTRIGFNAPFDKVAELTRAERPLLIAIHGLPGCGKSYTLDKLQDLFPSKQYLFFETWTILSKLSRGIDRFENANAEQKMALRAATAQEIARECTVVDKAGIVSGLPYLSDERHAKGAQDIDTPIDCSRYSCVFFLHVPVQVLIKRRMLGAGTTGRKHLQSVPIAEINLLQQWQDAECERLSKVCEEGGVAFERIDMGKVSFAEIADLVRGVKRDWESKEEAKKE